MIHKSPYHFKLYEAGVVCSLGFFSLEQAFLFLGASECQLALKTMKLVKKSKNFSST